MRRTAMALITLLGAATLAAGSAAEQHDSSSVDFGDRVESLRLAIEDLIQTFGDQYPGGQEYLKRLKSIGEGDFPAFQREALLTSGLANRASRCKVGKLFSSVD